MLLLSVEGREVRSNSWLGRLGKLTIANFKRNVSMLGMVNDERFCSELYFCSISKRFLFLIKSTDMRLKTEGWLHHLVSLLPLASVASSRKLASVFFLMSVGKVPYILHT